MTSIASGPPSGLPPRLARVAHLAQRRVGDETVVVDLRNSRVFGLNPAGGELLEALREAREIAELEAWAAAGGDRAAVATFLGEMLGAGLVAPAESGSATASAPLAARSFAEPRLLWREEVARVTHQTSPPQAITNPQCQP
jgi:hypothetical protein